MSGRTVRVVPLVAQAHADDLYTAFAADSDGRNWTYLPIAPFGCTADCHAWAAEAEVSEDPLFHAILDRDRKAMGFASYLRIEPAHGVIEVGFINFAPRLQRSVMATEAMYLMMRRVFDELGYRRYEWKCDALNAPSRNAARRLGFTYEGTFRQATHYKGRNRDTAWFSITDREWPEIQSAFQDWLLPENFDAEGRQRTRLDTWSHRTSD